MNFLAGKCREAAARLGLRRCVLRPEWMLCPATIWGFTPYSHLRTGVSLGYPPKGPSVYALSALLIPTGHTETATTEIEYLATSAHTAGRRPNSALDRGL